MSDNSLKYTKGELVIFSSGEYDYYWVDNLVKVLIDFDASILLVEWAKENSKPNSTRIVESAIGKAFKQDESKMSFLGWLIANCYVESVEFRELNTGSRDGTVTLEDNS
ncbi:hypothetical protein [Vibrio vulnificus]|uniref:hypothetical protein n=1 Tax=Vibrio vulnificus TaxID=672 RepID=UPI001A29CC75|nr:hypothetical protein [Vibrio vulnificus]